MFKTIVLVAATLALSACVVVPVPVGGRHDNAYPQSGHRDSGEYRGDRHYDRDNRDYRDDRHRHHDEDHQD